MSVVVPHKVPPLGAGGSHSFVFGRRSLYNYALVPLVVYRLPICLHAALEFVQDTTRSWGSWLGPILVLNSVSWYAFLTSIRWPLHCSVRASHAACPCPAPCLGRLSSHQLMVALAEPGVVRSKTLQSPSFAWFHVRSATTLSVTVSAPPCIDASCCLGCSVHSGVKQLRFACAMRNTCRRVVLLYCIHRS